ncbi:hypothetical protein EVAR_12857_1 [Eumeta japonica]|uniref:Uncharacterized protein n=1 Tax=Eumeta variegata TaxID=151549 RepID=A0A4C1TVN7_EUMVA|nr:hypothetical protein EVAR_12857_1 [Eumeta japonica]
MYVQTDATDLDIYSGTVNQSAVFFPPRQTMHQSINKTDITESNRDEATPRTRAPTVTNRGAAAPSAPARPNYVPVFIFVSLEI